MKHALDGTYVLDLSRFIAGPSCAMHLADMGADVIKVERPGGEDARQNAPFLNGHSIYAMTFNRNKRAITVNTRSEKGIALLERLVEWADVVVENYRPGTMEAMGLGYEDLCRINPRIVLTSISGMGQTVPQRNRAMFDAAAQAASGLAFRNGREGEPPMFTGAFLADYIAGAYAAFGTMLALFHRERTGRGQVVDISLLDSLFSVLGIPAASWLLLGTKMPRTGNRDAYTAPAGIFEAADGYVYLHAGTDALFRRLVEGFGRPETADDPAYGTVAARMANVEATEALVAGWLAQLTTEEACAVLDKTGVPYSQVADMEAATSNEQLRAREMIVEVEHAEAGKVVVPGVVVKMSETPGEVREAPPLVGQHTDEVLTKLLGLTPEEVGTLRAEGAI